MTDYTMRQATTEDWESLKNMRLEALMLHGNVFDGDVTKEAAQTAEQWQELIRTGNRQHFFLENKNDIAGYAGVLTVDWIPETAIPVGIYVREAYRGLHLSDVIFRSLEKWAVERNYPKARVYHRASNKAAEKMILRNHYEKAGEEDKLWADGETEKQYFYEKILTP